MHYPHFIQVDCCINEQGLRGAMAVDLPASFLQLKKFVKMARRPYQSQTFAIMSQLLVLASHFSKEDNKSKENLDPLTTYVGNTLLLTYECVLDASYT